MSAARYLIAPVFFLSLVVLPAASHAGLLDGCYSSADPVGFPVHLAVCPAGDGQTLADVGARIDVVTRDPQGNTVSHIPWQDIWMAACSDYREVCFFAFESHADASTDANGYTTISSTVTAGGQGDGVTVFLQAIAVLEKPGCAVPDCLPLSYRSADINDDFVVDLLDFAVVGTAFPPGQYNEDADFDFDGAVGLLDLAFFGQHFGHLCP